MKKFTLKDFVLYNVPCFSCSNKIQLKLISINKKTKQYSDCHSYINNNCFLATLQYNYFNSLSVSISISKNILHTSNHLLFDNFLNENALHVVNKCPACNNFIISHPLSFDNLLFLHSISIMREIFNVSDNNFSIFMISEFDLNSSKITINSKHNLELPIIPLSKFKNKENLLKKIRIYHTLS